MRQLRASGSSIATLVFRFLTTGAQRWHVLFLLTIGLTMGSQFTVLTNRSQAATPETAPAPLKQLLTQIDAAANTRNSAAVLKFYSPNFTHSDGLNRQTLEQSLTQLWKQFPDITYRTELKSWQPEGNGFQADTVTYITGTQTRGGRQFKLTATLQSRQRFQNQQLVQQDILAEQSQLKSGDNPPTIQVSLPQQVRVGQEFSFDAIVEESLGNDLLLGTAIEEPVSVKGYLNPTTLDLELLSSGGLFKIGRAPNTPSNRWISAVLVRHDGMTLVTQRLRVVGRNESR